MKLINTFYCDKCGSCNTLKWFKTKEQKNELNNARITKEACQNRVKK